jgi:hypothetical protein
MLKRLFLSAVLAGLLSSVSAETFTAALSSLKESPYGFYFVDGGITAEDLADFNSIDMREERFFHQFGELSEVEGRIADFLSGIGMNERRLVERAAARLAQITHQIVELSGRETAWVHLRASVPTDRYDIPRWHMDGYYFTPVEGYLMYKFAVTLVGPSTLFYPIPQELRRTAWRHMLDRKYMQEFCQADRVMSPKEGEGVVFLAGKKTESALHSEPPIHQNRLFFSITPCNEKQLAELKVKVLAVYPKDQPY